MPPTDKRPAASPPRNHSSRSAGPARSRWPRTWPRAPTFAPRSADIQRMGSAADRSLATRLRLEHENYVSAAEIMFAAVDRHAFAS